MKIFDPLGLLGHIIIYLKIILKRVWRLSIEWDEPVSEEIFSDWKFWLKVIPSISEQKIPRCYTSCEANEYQLHIFVDAGIDAFAAVAYLRTESSDGIECSLIASKTRVTPQKLVSMPRLELQAAVLGVRLAKFVMNEHRIKFCERKFWCDSKTVLSWLRRDQSMFKQFVAFRIGEILEDSDIAEWNYVPSKDNVADYGTKWKSIPSSEIHSKWFKGPQFLNEPESNWNQESCSLVENAEENICEVFVHQCGSLFQIVDPTRFSKWYRMVRSTAYVWRFIQRTRAKIKNHHTLEKSELEKAENILYRQAQYDAYCEDISLMEKDFNLPIEKRRYVHKSSSLYKLCPFIDENHVLRMYGRISLSQEADEDTKQPIILPGYHQITRLIVKSYHERFGHANTNTVFNEVRQKFYIPKLRSIIYSIRSSCQTCKIRLAIPRQPIMSDLPSCRLSIYTRPFSYIGIDYFGPLKVSRGRVVEKRWGVLITCLTIRAIHIELAETLTTDSCILAINRFIARRGFPMEIYCDNGTNFRGVEKELQQHLTHVDNNKLAEKFTSSNTKWNFNPPASPHMGGSWERMVRSVKKAMYEILPKMPRNPTGELLYSVMLAAEHIVNSRPLTYVPVETEEADVLTPNHFLLGNSNGVKAIGEFNDDAEVLRKNWMIMQQQQAAFCRKWIKEYLPTLTRRVKCFEHTEPLKIGDLVLIVDDLSPIDGYKRGIITKVFHGKNNAVRSAVVRTSNGELTRPVVKLAVLDVSGNMMQDQIPGGSVNNSRSAVQTTLK